MKPRTQFLIAIGVLILIFAITWISFSRRDQEPEQTLQATINRDCAPWDGSAFTVSVPMKDGTIIYISIWQSPDIKLPARFSFPDETGQVGSAYILPELDPLQPLSGEVSFRRVEEGIPVEGEFNFMTESGKQFKGKFKAGWGNEIIYCG
jgi:hypothetical protein